MEYIVRIYKHFSSDSLYRNSIYLMLSTAVMAFFGFFFWIINARLFTAEQVGIATALISVVTLISSFSLLGLNNGIIRYLPTSVRKNQKINTSFTLVAASSALIALAFLIFINLFSPKLLFVRENIFFAALFILFIIFSTQNMISENIFIAYRSSKYVLIKNTVFSIVKLVLPVFLISLGAYGIFASIGIATIIAFILSLIILIFKFNYLIYPTINKDVVRKMTKFSLGNYVAGFIGGLPVMLLPIIILNSLGAKFSAYFYIDLMIANFLYIIPMATSQSLFAEGSYSKTELKTQLLKAIKIISIIIIPAITAIFLFGNYILLTFGSKYSNEGLVLLRLLSVSGVFISINFIGNAILNIQHKISLLILLNLINTFIIILLSIILIKINLYGVGLSWLIGQVITATTYMAILWKNKFFVQDTV